MKLYRSVLGIAAGLAVVFAGITSALAQGAIDNSALEKDTFREHKATYGLVYRLPKEVTDELGAKIYPPLRKHLLSIGLKAEAETPNIQHVTVVHVHSADTATPLKMLKAVPKLPPVLNVHLKDFYNTEASKGAGAPWWFDLGIVKSGDSFEAMMAFNTAATAALTPFRDGPLPRCTGPVYAHMSDGAKELTRSMGVSGVNVMKDGKEVRSHNPHNTLVYSMTKYDDRIQASMKQMAEEANKILPDGIKTSFKEVSIVEIGFMGNVLREIYRISLADGSVIDVASGKAMPK